MMIRGKRRRVSAVARARRNFVSGRTRQRSATNWSRFVSTTFTSIGVGTKVLFATFALGTVGIGETVRRTRGRILIFSDQVAQHELLQGAFGMVIVNDLALAAGAASIPGPVTDQDDDGWFVWESLMAVSTLADNTAPAAGHSQVGGVIDFDSKAMRRVEEGFGIALMFENSNVGHLMRMSMGISLLGSRN